MQRADATLEIDSTTAIATFRNYAADAGRPVSDHGRSITVALPRGSLTVMPDGAGTRLRIESPDAVALQLARDLLVSKLASQGVVPRWQEDLAGRQPGNQSRATVLAARRLSPNYSRVVIEGPDLARFAEAGLHFRLLFGPEGAGWPETDAGGATRWPGGMTAWHRPVYTTRAIEVSGAAARITFDVFRHAGGRVTEWCDRVAPGAEIAMTGPGGGGLPEMAGWMGLVGDETALPVMIRILEAMPDNTRGEAVLFVPDAADIQSLRHPEGVSLRWVLRGGDETPLAALKTLIVPAQDRYVFFAGEKVQALAARAWLPEQGLKKGEFISAAYWS
ncbi:siderophore-interacting protein [Salipiger bermudensis]|uniref:siderophore-interacting protein n=1 Tax=Salipiger bermudensis TaxID=344736 RepID=UPI001A8CA1AC|nr:siderophore-interacting protein [Salipiger bermudensis]MBN9675516.1 siderophore-interacting protein [Salipiger bermudensis]